MSSSPSNNDLRNRIIFTLAILTVYRFGTFVPLPGIDPEQLKIMMEGNQKGLLGMFNVFAGGAVSRMAIFALGIMPYISSAIIVHLGHFSAIEIRFTISLDVATFPVGLFGLIRTRRRTCSSIFDSISSRSIRQPSVGSNRYSTVVAPNICGYAM